MTASGILDHPLSRVTTPHKLFAVGARKSHIVVPAKAGTHNHKWLLVRDGGTTSPFDNICHGLWVPAFAGTTVEDVGRCRPQHTPERRSEKP
jgi:hypothetical protein